jgi:hypothetical protein
MIFLQAIAMEEVSDPACKNGDERPVAGIKKA